MSLRVRSLLELRRHDPDGQVYPADAFVFGAVDGSRVKSVRRAWVTAVLKANGIKPEWTRSGQPTPACHQAYQRIGLHLHDLRRESGSRLIETGADPAIVQKFLGHANLTTTSRYLAPASEALHLAVKRAEQARGESKSGNLVANADRALPEEAATPPSRNSVN